MPSVQYVIDTICASVTVECVYQMIEASLSQTSFTVAELLPLIQSKDLSLDLESARMIAKAALDDMAKRGIIRIEGDLIYPAVEGNHPDDLYDNLTEEGWS
jgi:hypothetical protein